MSKPCWIIYKPSMGAISTTEDGRCLLFQSERTAQWQFCRTGADKDGFSVVAQQDAAVLIRSLEQFNVPYVWVEEPMPA
jgi:hypothetical protein